MSEQSPIRAVRSLLTWRSGRWTLYFVPLVGVMYGAISLAVVLAIGVGVDRVLGRLESAGWTSGEQWKRHNQIVEENHRRKTTTKECELRQWNGEPLPSGKQRTILVIGDSFVWGPPYVSLNHLWWRQLAIELERRGYHDVRVVAVGQPGWSTRRQLECARQLVPEVKPDLIVWGYVTNDPDEKIVRQIFDSQDQPPYGQRIRQKLKWLLPNLSFKFESLRADKLAVQYAGPEYGYAYADWELKLVDGENFERYRETVREIGEFLKEAGVPAFLQTLPHFPGQEYFRARYEPVLREWKIAGVTVHDSLDDFVRRYGEVAPTGKEAIAWGINPGDSHPGPQATHFLAVQAADFIEEKWPETLGPKDLERKQELVINDWLPEDLNVRQTSRGMFHLDYPAKTNHMPMLPEPPAAVVALRHPLPLSSVLVEGPLSTVSVEGNIIKAARVWVLYQAQDEYQDDTWHELKTWQEGSWEYWVPPEFTNRPVSAIRFTADIQGNDRRLQLIVVTADMRPFLRPE